MSALALRSASLALAALTIAVASASCGEAPGDARIGVVAPDLAQFPRVGDLLGRRCGSLDCHGATTRSLQIVGCEGLRLGDAKPGCRDSGGTNTTADEYTATYRSVVGLEPAVMSAVVQGKGAHPELLTLVRKARGAEAHKGGDLFAPGDDQDNCVATWLAGKTDVEACARGTAAPVIAR